MHTFYVSRFNQIVFVFFDRQTQPELAYTGNTHGGRLNWK